MTTVYGPVGFLHHQKALTSALPKPSDSASFDFSILYEPSTSAAPPSPTFPSSPSCSHSNSYLEGQRSSRDANIKASKSSAMAQHPIYATSVNPTASLRGCNLDSPGNPWEQDLGYQHSTHHHYNQQQQQQSPQPSPLPLPSEQDPSLSPTSFSTSYLDPKVPSPPPAPPLQTLANDADQVSSQSSQDVFKPFSTSVSEWCAQMVCYIWFAALPEPFTAAAVAPPRSPSRLRSPLSMRHRKRDSLGSLSECSSFSAQDLSQAVEAHARSNSDMNRYSLSALNCSPFDSFCLRLSPRPKFKAFVRDMLNTTQVSKSVVTLALLYIHRLKSKHPGLKGQEGSEFRLFVTALMLANKFLDDHTYTNKTWSELSGIELKDVTKMEVEFWLGLSMSIHVSDTDFRNWIRTLESLAERRKLALIRRDHELARQAAMQKQQQQEQQLQQQHQQQQAAAAENVRRRYIHRSRVSQSQTCSPSDTPLADGVGLSPFRAMAWSINSSPSAFPSETANSRFQGSESSAPFHYSVSNGFATSESTGSSRWSHHHLSPVSSESGRVERPSSSSSARELGSLIMKRPLTNLYSPTAYEHAATPSPERSNKRQMGQDGRAVVYDRQLHTLLPIDFPHTKHRQSTARAAAAVGQDRSFGTSPICAQPFSRSVFEPLVSTPNTLLAPYSVQNGGLTHQQRQHPLAYWQLAAGYDRGILGLHLPAPVTTSNEYYTPASIFSHRSSSAATLPEAKLPRRPVSTTTPYQTPTESFLHHATAYLPCRDTHTLARSHAEGRQLDSYIGGGPPLTSSNALAMASSTCLSSSYATDAGQAHPTTLQQLHAPHAPFNNAEGHYIDPFARFM